MKELLVAIAIVGGISNSLCAEQHEPKVSVREPLVVMVRRSQLPAACAATYAVDACTATAGQVLTCRCEFKDDQWHLVTSAQFIPVMYVAGATEVQHERAHIRDIAQALASYLSDRESLRFESIEACQEAAASTSSGFPRIMERFKDESNVLRHGESARRLAAK